MEFVLIRWPTAWTTQTFAAALSARRSNDLPRFCAEVELAAAEVREVLAQLDAACVAAGYYVLDHRAMPEPWDPAGGELPRAVVDLIEQIHVEGYEDPSVCLALSAAGQDALRAVTTRCRVCEDAINLTVGQVAQACRKHGLTRYHAPRICRRCKQEKEEARNKGRRLAVPVALHRAVKEPQQDAALDAAGGKMNIDPIV